MDSYQESGSSAGTENVGESRSTEKQILTTEDLEQKLENSFWRDILYEIIKNMDPWNIDICELASRYSLKVSQMEEMNFRIPANVVIVSAVLLRMKAQFMSFASGGIDLSAEEFIDGGDLGGDLEIPAAGGVFSRNNVDPAADIIIQPKRVLKRRITAMELIAAIQQVLEDKKLKSKIRDEELKLIDRGLVINLRKDIKHLIDETYERVMAILSSKNEVLFSELAHTREEMITTLVSLLHLSNNQKLCLRQEKLFEEIYITSAEKHKT